jgi:hypothetical protein
MSVQDIEEASAPGHKNPTAPFVGIAILIVAVLGFSAYWWHIARIADCAAGHLQLSVGQPQGTAGSAYMDVILTNKSAGSCSLDGYPAAFLANASGAILGDGASTSAVYTPSRIILAHDKSAHAVLSFPDAANFPPGSCSVASQYLKFYPPGLTTALQTAFTQYSCPGFSVTALQPGT